MRRGIPYWSNYERERASASLAAGWALWPVALCDLWETTMKYLECDECDERALSLIVWQVPGSAVMSVCKECHIMLNWIYAA